MCTRISLRLGCLWNAVKGLEGKIGESSGSLAMIFQWDCRVCEIGGRSFW